ncbi:Potassium channel [Aspergillus hancockii]|nr:Potassium channel [Aspergillus hancockii]
MDGITVRTSKASEKLPLWERLQNQFNPRPPDDDEPQDWWFASTAIPLIAATTSPFANVMSIVALAMPWKSEIQSDQQDSDGNLIQIMLTDPRWSIRYIIALPASIILWSLATAILVGITSSIHIYAPPVPPNQTYSQAYWYAVIAAIQYFILTCILMINMLGYFLGHYPQYFAITDGQRTLILQTTALGIWLIVGAAIFQKVISISVADALYFCDVTILTLGFGDVTPKTAVARGLILPYAVIGIVILGLVVTSINNIVRDLQDTNVMRKHIERKREVTIERSLGDDAQKRLKLTPNTSQIAYRPKHTRRTPVIGKVTAFYRSTIGRSKSPAMKEEKDRFDAMRAIQRESVVFRRWYRLILNILAFSIVWTCGAVVFWALQKEFTYFEALYFGFCSLLTIGYGDFTPTTNAAKPFFVVWSLIAVPTMTSLISEMSNTIVAGFKHATSQVADWTVLPHTGKYKSLFQKFPNILAYLEQREENKRVSQGFPIGPADVERSRMSGSPGHEGPVRSMDELANDKDPSDSELAQQLAFAIRRTVKDAVDGHPKRYSYEEWVEFNRMIRFTDPSPAGTVLYEDEYGILNWDWIGENSPMLASQTEPEWVLDRLCESMIRYISTQAQKRNSGLTATGAVDEDEPTLRKEKDVNGQNEGL